MVFALNLHSVRELRTGLKLENYRELKYSLMSSETCILAENLCENSRIWTWGSHTNTGVRQGCRGRAQPPARTHHTI